MADDIVSRLRSDELHEAWRDEVVSVCLAAADEIERWQAEASLKGYRLDDALDEIERLRAELEQATINQRHARTGQALLDLEHERQDRQRVEQSLIQSIARLCMDARDLRAHNEHLEQQLAARRTPTVRIDVNHETAAQKIADIKQTIDRIFDGLNTKDDHAETQP